MNGEMGHRLPPPIGVMPRWLWDEKRAADLYAAVARYRAAAMRPLPEWLGELAEIEERIARRRQP